MDHGHDHSRLCGGICHLNEAAKVTYLNFVQDERYDDAKALRERGVLPAGMSLPVLA